MNVSRVVFDCHTHIYTPSVIASVSRRDGLAQALDLDMDGAGRRLDKSALKNEVDDAGIKGCLLLPIAPASGVQQANELFVSMSEKENRLVPAGTLHPLSPNFDGEWAWLTAKGIRAVKLSSFSQGFGLESEKTRQMLQSIHHWNASGNGKIFVLLDTFYKADIYFGTPEEYITTPGRLARLAADFPEIDFIGAHMGGLCAPFQELEEQLVPAKNLYLDTSNASHSLTCEEFVSLVHRHGPEKILFGTDWPWFSQADEIARVGELLDCAGLTASEQALVFDKNISRLLGLQATSL